MIAKRGVRIIASSLSKGARQRAVAISRATVTSVRSVASVPRNEKVDTSSFFTARPSGAIVSSINTAHPVHNNAQYKHFSSLSKANVIPCRFPKRFTNAHVFKFQSRTYAKFNDVDFIELTMPALSPTMTQGNLSKWRKKVGDKLSVGDILAEIETDKATLEFESPEEGFLAKIIVPEGTHDVQCGRLIALIVESETDIEKVQGYDAAGAAPAQKPAAAEKPAEAKQEPQPQPQPQQPPQQQQQPTQAAPTPAAQGGRVLASPYAKTLAREQGVDLTKIKGTGPNNRIIAADVQEYLAKAPKAQPQVEAAVQPQQITRPVATAEYIDIPVSNIRKVIASRLLESKQTIPHYYLTVECRVDELMKVRQKLNSEGKDAYKLSVNDFIIKAAALALKKVPACNSSWMDTHIRQYNSVDISVAVQTDSGLITPIVKDADRIGLQAISNSVKSLAERARQNKLAPHEFQGGTFTISNLGMFGVKQFAAIVNPPQACILAVGTAEQRVVPSSDKGENASKFETANYVTVTLSCDHRVVDGAVGAQWLQAFKQYIENPISMLL